MDKHLLARARSDVVCSVKIEHLKKKPFARVLKG